MATYSHSKISTFENCPRQYKYRYIDRETPEIENTIEAFMGSMVHETLEKLYKDKKFHKKVSKASLIKFYRDSWDNQYSDDIKIVKEEFSANNYKKMGEKFVSDYYDTYKPFDQLTILGLETQDRMTLSDGNQWHVRIDKFACDSEGNYYVIDYKTNSRMKDQEEADSDRQLAMYSFWVRDKFRDAKSVKLVWHMLAFNKEVVSERTEEQLKKLMDDVVSKIKEIEAEKEFAPKVSALCNYCGYRYICPAFKHKVQLEKREEESKKKFKEDEGLKLVDEFSEIKRKKKELEEREEELKDNLIEFAKEFGLEIVYGSNTKASVKDLRKVVIPEENKEKIIEAMKKKGIWEDFEMLNYSRLNAQGRKGELDKDISKFIEIGEDFRVSLSKRKDVEE